MTLTTETILAFDETIRPLPARDGRHEACSPATSERLDPIVGGVPSRLELLERTQAARELCAHCPLIEACAAMGDEFHEPGVWGGELRWFDGPATRGGRYVVLPLIPKAK